MGSTGRCRLVEVRWGYWVWIGRNYDIKSNEWHWQMLNMRYDENVAREGQSHIYDWHDWRQRTHIMRHATNDGHRHRAAAQASWQQIGTEHKSSQEIITWTVALESSASAEYYAVTAQLNDFRYVISHPPPHQNHPQPPYHTISVHPPHSLPSAHQSKATQLPPCLSSASPLVQD